MDNVASQLTSKAVDLTGVMRTDSSSGKVVDRKTTQDLIYVVANSVHAQCTCTCMLNGYFSMNPCFYG